MGRKNIELDNDSGARYYSLAVIKSFRDKDTEQVFQRHFVKKFSAELHRSAWKKLAILDAAGKLDDLRVPPANRLEKLTGDRDGEYSIRINQQWRVCFNWHENDAYDVEIVDYH